MAKKKDWFDEAVESSESDSFDLGSISEMSVEDVTTPVRPMPTAAKVTLRILQTLGDKGYLVEGDNGETYIASLDLAFENRVAVTAQDDSRIEKLYTWEKEIEAMLPDRAAMVKAVQRSLYLAGAFKQGDLKKNEVAKNWSRRAFPYIIKEIEE